MEQIKTNLVELNQELLALQNVVEQDDVKIKDLNQQIENERNKETINKQKLNDLVNELKVCCFILG